MLRSRILNKGWVYRSLLLNAGQVLDLGKTKVMDMRSEEQQIYEMRKHKSYGYGKCSACGFILRYCNVKSAKGFKRRDFHVIINKETKGYL